MGAPSSVLVISWMHTAREGQVSRERTLAEIYAEVDSFLDIIATLGVDTVQEVTLKPRVLAEAKVHVFLRARQGRVLGDDILETCDLRRLGVSGLPSSNSPGGSSYCAVRNTQGQRGQAEHAGSDELDGG